MATASAADQFELALAELEGIYSRLLSDYRQADEDPVLITCEKNHDGPLDGCRVEGEHNVAEPDTIDRTENDGDKAEEQFVADSEYVTVQNDDDDFEHVPATVLGDDQEQRETPNQSQEAESSPANSSDFDDVIEAIIDSVIGEAAGSHQTEPDPSHSQLPGADLMGNLLPNLNLGLYDPILESVETRTDIDRSPEGARCQQALSQNADDICLDADNLPNNGDSNIIKDEGKTVQNDITVSQNAHDISLDAANPPENGDSNIIEDEGEKDGNDIAVSQNANDICLDAANHSESNIVEDDGENKENRISLSQNANDIDAANPPKNSDSNIIDDEGENVDNNIKTSDDICLDAANLPKNDDSNTIENDGENDENPIKNAGDICLDADNLQKNDDSSIVENEGENNGSHTTPSPTADDICLEADNLPRNEDPEKDESGQTHLAVSQNVENNSLDAADFPRNKDLQKGGENGESIEKDDGSAALWSQQNQPQSNVEPFSNVCDDPPKISKEMDDSDSRIAVKDQEPKAVLSPKANLIRSPQKVLASKPVNVNSANEDAGNLEKTMSSSQEEEDVSDDKENHLPVSCSNDGKGSSKILSPKAAEQNISQDKENCLSISPSKSNESSPTISQQSKGTATDSNARSLQKPRVFVESPESSTAVEEPVPKSYEEIIAMVRKALRNPKATWAHRCAAMDALSEHLKSSSPPTLLHDIGALKAGLAAQIEDTRSAVIRSVCRLIAALAEVTKNEFEDLAAFLIPKLLTRLYITIKVISSSAEQCIQSMLQSMGSAAINVIPKLVAGLSDSHAALRRGACSSIRLVIESASTTPSELEPRLSLITPALIQGLKDADREVRLLSRAGLHSLSGLFPELELPSDVEVFDLKHRPLLANSSDNGNRSEFCNLLK